MLDIDSVTDKGGIIALRRMHPKVIEVNVDVPMCEGCGLLGSSGLLLVE